MAKSQNELGWKGPQRVIWSNLTAHAGSPYDLLNGVASRRFWHVCSGGGFTVWKPLLSAQTPEQKRSRSRCSGGTSEYRFLPTASSSNIHVLVWLEQTDRFVLNRRNF